MVSSSCSLYRDSLTPDEGPLSLSLTRYLHISPGRASLLNKARELQGSDVPCDGEDAEKLKNTKVNKKNIVWIWLNSESTDPSLFL